MKYKFGSVSVIGGHKINQDSLVCRMFEWGIAAVVSDGLGSARFSHIGSRAVCEAVIEICALNNGVITDTTDFLRTVNTLWKKMLLPFDVSDCYATCLICIICREELFAARLGDGFIGIVEQHGVRVFLDDKTEHFANETDCLNEEFEPELWQIIKMDAANVCAVVMFTDGMVMGDGSEEVTSLFCREFYKGYKLVAAEEAEKDIHGWVIDWHGSDDKSIVFIIKDEAL